MLHAFAVSNGRKAWQLVPEACENHGLKQVQEVRLVFSNSCKEFNISNLICQSVGGKNFAGLQKEYAYANIETGGRQDHPERKDQ